MNILRVKFNKKILLFFSLAIITGFMLALRQEHYAIDTSAIDSIKKVEMFKSIIVSNSIALLLLCSALVVGKSVIYMFFGINGFLIGTVLGRGRSLLAILLLIPHGILEMGTYLFVGTVLYHLLNENEKGVKFLDKKKYLTLLLRSYFFLFISILIEVFVTPELVAWLSNL